ncbi:sigma 54-interacting transcriptional regulator [Nannocystis sp. SCPEA4]|uniref:sigma 54-interacting transcriptional regulator n=1 Tax=Nannocystis sp. SCPEA4 TaxID=2996787 RepID=UPI00226D719A|nr:sigma 54-interacting transcriptional regulator [Nannocystis sp. SCPEA4]
MADGVELRPDRDDLRFDLDGRSYGARTVLSTEALRQGIRLGLGRGALLHVRLGPPLLAPRISTVVGKSEALERVASTVLDAARSDNHVLVTGESGTGKELVARALHEHSPRSGRAFVPVNTAALSVALGPSQLFGHVRGAFTGAEGASGGFFGEANHGTLFLDEIAACPHEVQAQLLRALESGEVQVVGGSIRKADVRVIAATDGDLAQACADGSFREPLFHRLARWQITLPPLRRRPEDIAVQTGHFLRECLAARRLPWPTRDPDTAPWIGRRFIEALLDHAWPGNTRELRAFIERCVEQHLHAPTLPTPEFGRKPPAQLLNAPQPTCDLEDALARANYSLIAAAAALGISRNTLKRRMEAKGLRRPFDLDAEEIRAALRREGDVQAASRALRVSERGLRLRMTELGLSERG